jgi:dephospho-CoA kinase
MTLIGITGTNGAGKGTVVDYIVKEKGFRHYSAREFLLAEIRHRGVLENRSSMREVANDFRRLYGPAYVIEQLYAEAEKDGKDAVIESVRAIGEAEFLKSKGALIGAVDADRDIRYERIVVRGQITDKVSFEEFGIQEDREMASIEPWDMNVFGVMDLADFKIVNNGSIQELHAQIDALPIFKI